MSQSSPGLIALAIVLLVPIMSAAQSSEQDTFTFTPHNHLIGMQATPTCGAKAVFYRHWYWPWKEHVRFVGRQCGWPVTLGSQTQIDIAPTPKDGK